jgi:hypothetical protein
VDEGEGEVGFRLFSRMYELKAKMSVGLDEGEGVYIYIISATLG